ncbi:MAG: hypothetical protein NVSMB21_06980 [Vulcanimicrobiaceae bacterium]
MPSVVGTHPRRLGWIATVALAIGGSNQSLFLIAALFAGQDAIRGQGSAAVPLLAVGLVLAFLAAPGWTELVLLSRDRVGGIAAVCSDAFRPYSLTLSALAGCCYWWGWVPTCGLTALFSAAALHAWLLPWVPVTTIALGIVAIFTAWNLAGIRASANLAVVIGIASTLLAFLSALVPIVAGRVDWHQSMTFHLDTPFGGWFGGVTSLMAGLYLVGFAAPAFEAATCHVGETVEPQRNVPRAVLASAVVAALYFVVLPVVWLGALGPKALGGDLALALGPTFAPLFGAAAKSVALGFVTFSMFHGTLQPLAGASRTLAQLADDGIFPRVLGRRNAGDVPWVATLVTAVASLGFLVVGDPIWLVAAANFSYLIAIALASVAVGLLRRDAPEAVRPYRAPTGTIGLGIGAAGVWAIAAVLGFQQFGLPTIILGLAMAYTGGLLFAWRKLEDAARAGERRRTVRSLHLWLTAAMSVVLVIDGAGYLVAIGSIAKGDFAAIAVLEDLFVLVAMLTIGAGLILPSIIANAATRGLADVNETLRRGTERLESEIAERTLAESRLSHLATHDELTGLANRPLFMDRFRHLIARMQRRDDALGAVLFIDLDRFKLVNDSLGHLAGDAMLVAVARALERCMRPGDTLARMGGDEFTILLEEIAGPDEAIAFAERLLAELRAPFVVAEREMFASASIGIALTRIGFDSPEDVLRNADIALYRAKAMGKGRFELFTAELLTHAIALLQLENDLKRALERREFVLHYQPIVAMNDGALVGFEALVRWSHPQRGTVFPDEFITAAEECGAIVPIGAWVIDEACRQAALWRDTLAVPRPLAISVNVSAKQLTDPALVPYLVERLAAYALRAEHLHVEVTESALMSDPALGTSTLTAIRALGVAVHLDDFGTGYSSLGYLQRFPVDTLKIDRSFVSSAGSELSNPAIVETIASLAASLSMTTTAEGIETREQLDALRTLGCTHGQGYLFSRPLDALAATALAATWTVAAPFDHPLRRQRAPARVPAR